MEATAGKLLPRQKDGNITLYPTPASDLEPSVKTWIEPEWVEECSKNKALDTCGGKSFLVSIMGGHTGTSGNCQ